MCREVRGTDHSQVVCLQGILAKILKWIDKILLKSEEFQDEIMQYINTKPENKIEFIVNLEKKDIWEHCEHVDIIDKFENIAQ